MMSSSTGSLFKAPWFRAAALAAISLSLSFLWFWADGIRGSDWPNYLWAANTALGGENPYLKWAAAMATLPSGSWPGRADLPPLQLLLYMACLKLGGAPALLALFAATNAATAVLMDRMGLRCRRPGLSLLALFWVLFPLFTFWFLQQPSNKNIMTLAAVVIVLCASKADAYLLGGDTGRADAWTWLALLAAVFLGNFGWLGFAAIPVILLGSGWTPRKVCLGGGFAALLTVLLHVPYFPDWKVMYLFRFSRVTAPSMHTSPLRALDALLGHLGIHIPLQVPLLFLIVTLLAFFAYRHPGNAARSSALAMITMAMVRTDADPPTILMSLIIVLVALTEARLSLYLWVAATLVYSYLTTFRAEYGTALYAFNILLPLLLPVAFLVRELIRFNRTAPLRTCVIPLPIPGRK